MQVETALSSGGINEVSTPAVDARSQQPELKHTAVRVEKTTFGWHLLAARRGDAIALQQTLQPLLRDCSYASLRLHAEPSGGSRRHASGYGSCCMPPANARPMPRGWIAWSPPCICRPARMCWSIATCAAG
ncbi:hypothetical protein Xthr_19670 [Xanthomonas citri pv. thirumalacharii]|nr:hypothetical protein [Xanthomonas citri pv. thirumalacharii]